MKYQIILEILRHGTLGLILGGAIMATFNHYLAKKKNIYDKLNSIIEDRYRTMLVLMACAINIDAKKYFNENNENSREYYFEKIKEYYYHNILNSSSDVLKSIKKFIIEPNRQNYINVAVAMRKDLWDREIELNCEDIILDQCLKQQIK